MKRIIQIGAALALSILFAFNSAQPNEQLLASLASANGPTKNEWICQLAAPSYCTGERMGASTAHLEWASVPSAVSYSLMVYDLSTFELVQSAVVSATSIDLSGLQADKSYRCVIAAICSGGGTSSFIIVEDIMT